MHMHVSQSQHMHMHVDYHHAFFKHSTIASSNLPLACSSINSHLYCIQPMHGLRVKLKRSIIVLIKFIQVNKSGYYKLIQHRRIVGVF